MCFSVIFLTFCAQPETDKSPTPKNVKEVSVRDAPPKVPIRFFLASTKKDSGFRINQNTSDDTLNVLLFLNRVDKKHLLKLDSFVYPDIIVSDFRVYSSFPQNVSVLDSVKKIIFFSYWFQSFAVYENGKLQRVGPISMGKKSTPTPTGLFHTNWKSKSTVSTINDEWVMNWYFNLENKLGVSMHEFELPGYPASHACIRLLQADAFWFYYWADSWKLESSTKIKSLGTPVIIYGEYPFGQIKPWRRIINNSLQVNVEEEIEREIKNFIPLILERQTSLDSLSVK